eukprot:7071174-Prymnesium_polylepis.2
MTNAGAAPRHSTTERCPWCGQQWHWRAPRPTSRETMAEEAVEVAGISGCRWVRPEWRKVQYTQHKCQCPHSGSTARTPKKST